MNKRGVVWEELADVFLALLIIGMGITMFLVVSGFQNEKVDDYFEQRIENLNDDDVFVSMLQADIDGKTFADRLIEAHMQGELPDEEIDTFFTTIYDAPVCWSMEKDGESWVSMHACSQDADILSGSVLLPTPDEPINVSLVIEGYA